MTSAINLHILGALVCDPYFLSLLSLKGPGVNFVTTDRAKRFVVFMLNPCN